MGSLPAGIAVEIDEARLAHAGGRRIDAHFDRDLCEGAVAIAAVKVTAVQRGRGAGAGRGHRQLRPRRPACDVHRPESADARWCNDEGPVAV